MCQDYLCIFTYVWRKKLQPLYKNHAPLYQLLKTLYFEVDKETTVFQRRSKMRPFLPISRMTLVWGFWTFLKIVRVFEHFLLNSPAVIQHTYKYLSYALHFITINIVTEHESSILSCKYIVDLIWSVFSKELYDKSAGNIPCRFII